MHVFAAAMPVDIADHALGEQVASLGARHWAQVDVGKMGEGEQETRSRFVIAKTLDGVASVENAQV